ncbi:MAG: beta-galactosidase trimerization domain-containing protein [Phycisphaeraceae bacterium]|nr:beta-galactosidase trimerization domain-containing protein [Phycisphaeraceae bacterium]
MPHNYLHDLLDKLHETPMQRRMRKLAPMPIGCVFLQWPEMSEEDIRGHLRTMKELGYTNLKGIMICKGMTPLKLGRMALEEGIIPWWYDIGGYEEITPELLDKLGLPRDMDIDEAIDHPKMRAHQNEVMLKRLERKEAERLAGKRTRGTFRPAERDPHSVPGVNKSPDGTKLLEESVPAFIEWLKETYDNDLEKLKHAWNAYSSSYGSPGDKWQSWDDLRQALNSYPQREFRHLRDILRFKADVRLRMLRGKTEESLAADPFDPVRAGGEISIFLPHVSWAIDMEGYADVMADGGAFYPSMHPGWHLEEVAFELVRPTYMQASMCADWAKGSWSAPLESTGGPQWWSGGGKVPFVPEVRELQPAFTIDEGTMAQLLCTYLAAGFRGFGLWCWNPRDSGWEAGEYALCDRNNQVTERARQVGRFGQAMRKYRRELWEAHKEPWVGLYQDWENDAMWAALATPGRDRYKSEPVKARIGASRALINANVPWEHVTLRQIEKGLAPRYRVIYLPAVMCLSSRLIELLTDYVKQGGRVVLDMPGAYLDERGHLIDTLPGSPFEALFGVVIHEYAYSNNVQHRVAGIDSPGFAVNMTPISAKVIEEYDVGGAAITENSVGKGTAVVVGAQVSLNCLKPGNAAMERLLVSTALGKFALPFTCEGAICYRLAAPTADHYFLINDGPARAVRLDVHDYEYSGAVDAVTGEKVDMRQVKLGANDAVWIRAANTGR